MIDAEPTTNELLAELLEATREAVGVLRSIEMILDETGTRTEVIQDHTGESAYWARGWLRRLRDSWAHAKFIADLTEAEGKNDLPVLPERWLK